MLRSGIDCAKLQEVWDVYGDDCLCFVIIRRTSTEPWVLHDAEKYYLDSYDPLLNATRNATVTRRGKEFYALARRLRGVK